MPQHFRMPAEWAKHDAVWLAWPHNKEDWPGRFGPIPWAYVDFIRLLSARTKVRLVVKNEAQRALAQDYCDRAGVSAKQIEYVVIPTNRVWMRDCGPIYITDGKQKIMLDWRFNAWAKYPNHKLDDAVPERINYTQRLDRVQPVHKGKRVVLEGGAIDVNGVGTLLTTEECLLSKTQCRNPGFTRADYEAVFAKYLGVTHTIWLGKGIAGDDTHGHVDDLARFVNATTVVTVVEKDKRDDNYALLQDNLKRLKQATDQRGKKLNVATLPMPKPVVFEGQRLPLSYANFLISNGLVLVPTFNDPADRVALSILAELMPKHEVVGLHCGDFIWGLGTLHCASQQEPSLT